MRQRCGAYIWNESFNSMQYHSFSSLSSTCRISNDYQIKVIFPPSFSYYFYEYMHALRHFTIKCPTNNSVQFRPKPIYCSDLTFIPCRTVMLWSKSLGYTNQRFLYANTPKQLPNIQQHNSSLEVNMLGRIIGILEITCRKDYLFHHKLE